MRTIVRRRQLAAPERELVGIDLDVELHAQVRANREGLVGAGRVAGDPRGALGQCEGLEMPLAGRQLGHIAQPVARQRVVGARDLAPADLGHRVVGDDRTQRASQHLAAQAVAEHRHVARHGVAQQRVGTVQERQVVVGAHAAAEHGDGVEGAGIHRHLVTRLDVAHGEVETARLQPGGEVGRAVVGLRLQDQDPRLGSAHRRLVGRKPRIVARDRRAPG